MSGTAFALTNEQKTIYKAFLYFLTREKGSVEHKAIAGDNRRLNDRALYKLYFAVAENDELAKNWSAAFDEEIEDQITRLPVAVCEREVGRLKVALLLTRFMKALRLPLPITEGETVLISLAQAFDTLEVDKQIGRGLLTVASEIFTGACLQALPGHLPEVYNYLRNYILAELYLSLEEKYADEDFAQTVAYLCKIRAFFGAAPHEPTCADYESETAIHAMLEELKKGAIVKAKKMKEGGETADSKRGTNSN